MGATTNPSADVARYAITGKKIGRFPAVLAEVDSRRDADMAAARLAEHYVNVTVVDRRSPNR